MSRRGKSATSVFVRNVHHEARAEDLKKAFSKYGDVSDVYLPLDYYTRVPRGFAYIQYEFRDDAEDAIHYLDGTDFFGRAVEVQMAEGDRKTPGQMRFKEGGGSSRRRGGRRSYSRSRSRSRSRSPRRRRRSPSKSRSRSPPRHPPRHASKSRSPRRRSRSRSRSPQRRVSGTRSRTP